MTSGNVIKAIDDAKFDKMDREFRAALAKACQGMSPLELGMATLDWISHLSISPGKRLQLAQSLTSKLRDLGIYSVESIFNKDAEGPASKIERRMSGEAWQRWPFNVFAQSHQVSKDWWKEATIGVDGVRPDHETLVHSVIDQILDMMAPANTLLTNPEVINSTVKERGGNLLRGFMYFLKDQQRDAANNGIEENDKYKVGENVACTPGKVVFQNDLIELIQYKPTTEKVGAEPVLVAAAWIMKYYILDLSPHNSMVKYLTEQGKTVFAISWKNPNEEDRDLGMEDYVHDGMLAAVDAVSAICPKQKINAVGYCIGGTLLSITAATMARNGDDRLKSLTLLAAQADFSEAGEIRRFISPSQLSFLENLMWKRGYLGSDNMGGAFSALRSSDLIYAGMVDRYLMGNQASHNDLMSWNADGTRMPYRMHSEYLSKLYLNNDLACNKFTVNDKIISLSDISVPIFMVGTETDHVAPWKSVYKLHGLTNGELTFLLTSGGHNAGIISGPEHPRRQYKVHTRHQGDNFIAPEDWIDTMQTNQGSWWPAWNSWLDKQTSKEITPPTMGNKKEGYEVLRDAPGEYVLA